MIAKVKIAADVAASLLQGAPKRLVDKLDRSPQAAAAWQWESLEQSTRIASDGDAVVELLHPEGRVESAAQVRCSCLLSPRCFHVIAVVSLLEVAAEVVQAPADVLPPAAASDELQSLGPGARTLLDVLARGLASGAQHVGSLWQAELLRGIHDARRDGLVSASRAATRVLAGVRALRTDAADFALATLRADWEQALSLALQPESAGSARRSYEAAGGLRVYGVCSAPVLTTSGYAGAITYLVTAQGELVHVSQVVPGGVDLARGAYHTGVGIGDVAMSHRELGRAGMHLAQASVSNAGRLSAGKKVLATRAAGCDWHSQPVALLWQKTWNEQIAAVFAHAAQEPEDRPSHWDWVFFDATVLGGGAQRGVRLAVAHDAAHEVVGIAGETWSRCRDNVIEMARAVGQLFRFAGKIDPRCAGFVQLIAASPLSAQLAVELGSHVNLVWERAAWPSARESSAPPQAMRVHSPHPFAGLRRRVDRVVMAGVACLPPSISSEIANEASQLERCYAPRAKSLLESLWQSSLASGAHQRGQAMHPPLAFAAAWLRLARYVTSVETSSALAAWTIAQERKEPENGKAN